MGYDSCNCAWVCHVRLRADGRRAAAAGWGRTSCTCVVALTVAHEVRRVQFCGVVAVQVVAMF